MTDVKKQNDGAQAQDDLGTSPDPTHITDAELDIVAGGLMPTAGVSSADTSVCISKLG